MHYYNMNYGGNGHVPILSNHHHNNNNNNNNGNHSKPTTYLFGCNQPASSGSTVVSAAKKNHSNDEIFLNTSGWVQVNTKRRSTNNDHKLNMNMNMNNGALKNTIRVIEIGNSMRGGKGQQSHSSQSHSVYSIPKITASKIEELISRNEARRYHQNDRGSRNYSFKPGYKILDPQISAMLNDRPGFLPVKNFKQSNSPPPMTPILSPPPAFQDNTTRIKTKTKHFRDSSEECEVCIASAAAATNNGAAQNSKGMVFSRSFEYDNRRIPNESYVDTFSRSFDCNLSDNPAKMALKTPNAQVITSPRRIHRERSPNFRTSSTTVPNTTTTTHTSSSVTAAIRDNSPKQNKDSSPIYMMPNGKRLEKSKSIHERSSRLRKNQLTKLNSHHHDRPQPQHTHYPQVSSVSRFRSFDAGNQRLNSCDSGARSDLSNDELDNEDDDSTEFLSAYQSSAPSNYNKQQKQRSLTPDRNDSHSSSNSLRKQRSVTPESRSLTPEDRRKKGSQASLNSRQNSSSRSNTLERKKYDNKSLSASRSSSSSSSYSGVGNTGPEGEFRRSQLRSSKSSDDQRIRRSRSLQLNERSPNQGHKQKHPTGPPPLPNRNSSYNSKPPRHPQQPTQSQSRGFRSAEVDKSRSFDLDYGSSGFTTATYNHNNTNYTNNRSDLDKSRSFDEDYREPSGTSSGGSGRYLKATNSTEVSKTRKSSPRQTTSPQNYGTRLCDHELTYDMVRRTLDRSPIMDFSRDYDNLPSHSKMRNSETINAGGNSELNFMNSDRIYDHPTTIPLKGDNESLTPDSSNEYKSIKKTGATATATTTTSSSSLSSINTGHRGTTSTSRGSCFVSCDKKEKEIEENLRKSSNNNILVYWKSGISERELKPREPNKLKESTSLTYLSDCEKLMTSVCSIEIKAQDDRKVDKMGRNPSDSKNRYSKNASNKRRLSLPNISQLPFPNEPTSSEQQATINLHNQLRAVSSPSLCEQQEQQQQKQSTEMTDDANPETEDDTSNMENIPISNRSSVIQRFKKTFTNFKSYSPTAVSAAANISQNAAPSPKSSPSHTSAIAGEMDSNGKYRFGPLVWRSSKERKKSNRRDKCNSGDSGIQVEIDDSYGPESIDILIKSNGQQGDKNKTVRRAFSAKVPNISPTSSLSMKANAIKKDGGNGQCLDVGKKFTMRSLSQPSGLDRIPRIEPDESDTDSVTSHPDFHIEGYNRPIYAEVVYAFQPVGPQELLLEQGALVEILRKEKNGGPWWYGRIKHDAILEKILEKQEGWFPKEFVRILNPFVMEMENKSESEMETSRPPTVPTSRPCEVVAKHNENHITTITVDHIPSVDDVESTDAVDSPTAQPISQSPSPSQRNSQNSNSSQISINGSINSTESLRNSVVKELLETEINYEKLLSSLCLGFIPEMRRRIDIFSTESLNLIFSNIECIWRFQQTFLEALKIGIETDRIAKVFLEHQSEFMVYSSYCNSYPRALMELESYARSKEAKKVLENCRAAENLPELPLSAHLLAPIQRICRYPLQLNELIKHTQETYTCNVSGNNHHASPEDFDEIDSSFIDIADSKESLDMALNAMKKVTETVNEGKRHSEHLARFQSSFESFQGPPLHFHSTRFFMQTDATRVSPNLWNNTFTLFLFDHQLIYCKKDLLKRNHFMYKGRIFLDNCRILNLPDGKIFGATVKNALRIFCESRQKWFDFSFRSASRKLRFLSTLAVERQFCGKSLFISEFAGGAGTGPGSATDDEDYSLDYSSDCDIYDIHQHSRRMSPAKFQKYNESLPKKPKNFQSPIDYNSSSLGRRRLGNWFRKSKSTNTTPNQSPTHVPHHPSPMTVEQQNNSEFKIPPQPQHTLQSSLGSTISTSTTTTATTSSS